MSPTNTPKENFETPLPSRLRFWNLCSGNPGDCRVRKLATDPSPPHSADGSSDADISSSAFSATGLWKARMDGPLTRVPSERRQLLALHSDLSSVPVSPSCQRTTVLGRVVTHPAAVVLTVRTLFLRREEWDHNPPAITTRNSYWRRRQDSNRRVKSQ